MSAWMLLILSTSEWLIRLSMVPVILRRKLAPATSLAWLVVILSIPVLGVLLYALVGVQYLGRRRRRTYGRLLGDARDGPQNPTIQSHLYQPAFDSQQENLIRQAQQVTGNPIVDGSSVELIHRTTSFVDQLIADIHHAVDHVHVLFYIFQPDETGTKLIDALIAASMRGVTCRLMVDAAGSKALTASASWRKLQQRGVDVRAVLPVSLWRRKLARLDLRNHRKLAVIDGRLGYTGSHNIVNANYNHHDLIWIDLSGRFTGPIVAQMQAVFLNDWMFNTGQSPDDTALFPRLTPTGDMAMQIVPTGPNHEADSFRRVLLTALNGAQKRIIMTTPYLVPDESTTLALTMAADRGVDVSILTPARGDHPLVNAAAASHYERLMENGIAIHRFHGGLLHAKTITVDHAFALLGSANLDIRSFDLNFEISVLMYGSTITERLVREQEHYLAQTQPMVLEQWRQRPALRRYAENAAALMSPLL